MFGYIKDLQCNQLIKEYQENNNFLAYQELLDRYYEMGCRFATSYINRKCYSNLIHYSLDEINSYVYLSFHKAIKTFRIKENQKYCFKKYFFQLIQFDTMHEIKNIFNWEIISNYQKIRKEFVEDLKHSNSFNIINELDIKEKFKIALNYLSSKNIVYKQILEFKLKGMSNSEISKILNTTENIIKSRTQYIKKILLNRYKNIESIC